MFEVATSRDKKRVYSLKHKPIEGMLFYCGFFKFPLIIITTRGVFAGKNIQV
jgi:hypothetical protein